MNDMTKNKSEVNINKIQTGIHEREDEELNYDNEINETHDMLKNEGFDLSERF